VRAGHASELVYEQHGDAGEIAVGEEAGDLSVHRVDGLLRGEGPAGGEGEGPAAGLVGDDLVERGGWRGRRGLRDREGGEEREEKDAEGHGAVYPSVPESRASFTLPDGHVSGGGYIRA
jgi:hypothetical protein